MHTLIRAFALFLVLCVTTPGGAALADPPTKQPAPQSKKREIPAGQVQVRILAVAASEGQPHMDPQLKHLVKHMAYLRHDRYELVTQKRGVVGPGADDLEFRVQGGPRVVVSVREVGGDRAKVRVRMFRGQNKVVDTTVAIANHGTFIVAGPKYRDGILILPIRVDYRATMPTLFEKIIAGEVPADIVYEDDGCVAFRDINPQAPIHVLVVPRKPIVNVAQAGDEDGELLGRLILGARNVARVLGVDRSGYRLVVNNGEGAGQTVYHLHVHLLAGRNLTWPPG